MASVLVPSLNYQNDQRKIMDDIIEYALKAEEDAEPLLKFFRREEKDLQKSYFLNLSKKMKVNFLIT